MERSMNKKLTLIIVFFTLLTLSAAGWLAYEAATLDTRLLQIDKEAQQKRLVALSIPRIQAEINNLLAQERNKLGYAPSIGLMVYDPPVENKPDYVRGYFLLSPAGLQVPEGQELTAAEIEANAPIIDTIRRKAFNPSAPVYDHTKPTHQQVDLKTQLPVFGVYEAEQQDFDQPLEIVGDPGPFYSWYYIDDMVYMRNIRTTHGSAAEGIFLDAAKLAEHLKPWWNPLCRAPASRSARRRNPPTFSRCPWCCVPVTM